MKRMTTQILLTAMVVLLISSVPALATRACATCKNGDKVASYVPGMSCDQLEARMCQSEGGIVAGTFVCPCTCNSDTDPDCVDPEPIPVEEVEGTVTAESSAAEPAAEPAAAESSAEPVCQP